MSFRLNDKVVYPGHGVAIIEERMERVVSGKELTFFKLRFLCKDMTILIPVEHNGQVSGVRALSDESMIQKAFDTLYKEPAKVFDTLDFTPSSWNRRNKEFQLKLQDGKLQDLIDIYRDLMYMSKHKDLSFGEKKMLQTTEELLVQEIMIVRGNERNDVIRELRLPFQQVSFSSQIGLSDPTVAHAI